MPFVIDESFLPATLSAPPMNDAQFAELCAEHPDLRFEITAEGELLVMAATFSLTGARNLKIHQQLGAWTEKDGRGVATDSSCGYVLPNGARRSPDAAWVARTQLRQLSPESLHGFWRLCPSFVVELKSETDRLSTLRKKMVEYLDNGAQLGWLIDPETRSVEVYRPGLAPDRRVGIDSIAGEGPLEDFMLDLKPVWNPLG